MSLLINFLEPLFSPADDSGDGGSQGVKSANDVLKMLGDDDPGDEDDSLDLEDKNENPVEEDSDDSDAGKTGSGDKSNDEPESDESDAEDLDELEDDLADDEIDADDKEFELIAPARKKEILAKYPKLFEDFPYLQVAYYRDKQFTEVFPTVGEAREAKEGLEVLARFDGDLKEGNIQNILSAALQSDKNSFYTIIDNLMPAIASLDEKAHHHIIGRISNQIISALVEDSKKPGMEVLGQAALVLNQYIYGTNDPQPTQNLAPKKEGNPEQEKLAQERNQFLRERFDNAREEISTRIDNSIRATLDQNIDPKGQMTDYVKRNAMRDVQEKLETIMRKDARFKSVLTKLWQKAQASNFNDESRKAIRSAYLGRAKALLPGVINAARREALKGLGRKVKEDSEENSDVIKRQTSRKGPITPGGSTTSVNRGKSDSGSKGKNSVPNGMSIRDFILAD